MNWISVKERLPEKSIDCLIWDDLGDGFPFIDVVGYNAEDGVFMFDGVTHWQPLPAPPSVKE